MKTLLSLILVNFLVFSVYAQSPFQDAIILSDSAELSGNEVKIDLNDLNEEDLEIFSKYIEVDDIESQFNIISNNPFIRIIGREQSDIDLQLETKSNILTDFSSLNVTNIADGLAKFLVERTKQELSIAFFEKFYTILDEEEQLSILFPSTYKTLKVIGDEIYMFSGYIEMLRQAFQKDLAALLPNIIKLVDDDSMDQVFTALPELRSILSDGIYLAMQLKDGKHIGDALNNYVNTELDSAKLHSINENLYTSIVLLNIFSQSLRTDEKSEKYWITANQLEELHNEKTLRIYLGLIYQQIYLFEQENSKLQLNGKHILTILDESAKTFNTLKDNTFSVLQPIIDKGKSIDEKFTQIKNLQDQADAEPGYNEYYELLDASLNFVEIINETYTSFTDSSVTKNFDNFITSARSLGNIYVNLNEKQYVSAVAELAFLYDNLIIEKLQQDIDDRGRFLEKLKTLLKDEDESDFKNKALALIDEYKKVIPSSDSLHAVVDKGAGKKEIEKKLDALNIKEYQKELVEKHKKLTDQLLKYGNFVAIVAKAENSNDVKAAIEAVALPAGSARIKRQSNFNIALNAYLGGFTGTETFNNQKGRVTGLSAPIGIAFSTGLRSGEIELGSLTAFLSIVDIGAFTSYRFENDSTANLPEVKLQNIFAPGIHGIYGIPKLPISIGYGYQLGPALREISATTTIVDSEPTSRHAFFFVVDIPITNFYTKSR